MVITVTCRALLHDMPSHRRAKATWTETSETVNQNKPFQKEQREKEHAEVK
jgi:hypothetical protein